MVCHVVDEWQHRVLPSNLEHVNLHQRNFLLFFLFLSLLLLFLVFFWFRLGLDSEVPIQNRINCQIVRVDKESGNKVRPLFLTLIDFDDSIEKSTSHFGQFHSVADNGLVPERTVLKRQVEDKPSGDGDIFPEFYIDEIQDVFFFDSAALFQLFQNVLLQFEQSSNNIAIIVSFGRVLLQEIGFLDQFLENTLNADVNEFELL